MEEPEPSARPDFLAEEWELVKDLVFECQKQKPENLDSWLETRCNSPKVRREVARLVRSVPRTGGFLDRPASVDCFGPPPKPPETIGRYRVIERLGAGGMGVVYAAHDDELNRRVAIKVLLSHTADDPNQQKRLRWDAIAASALQHPNIVTVHEIGSDGGMVYVVMECITGKTLGHLIPSTGMDPAEALGYAVQIASGLEAAHAAQVVHRDLKPGNIMITESGVVKLLDFGLAKLNPTGFAAGDAPSTIEGRFAGTVAYVSPEQTEGRTVDARSDIFSFGALLFEVLTGRRAFPGDPPIAVLADILHNDPPSLLDLKPDLDPRLGEIVHRCLRKKRERRFQSASEVRIRLQEIAEELQHAEQDRTASHAVAPRQRPRRLWLGVAVGALATAMVSAGLFWWLVPRERKFVLQRATNDMGIAEYPAISPDGKMLAFASDRAGEGNLDIYVQQVKGSDPLALTNNPADECDPVFALDGTQVIYHSDRDGGGLYISSSLGGSERLLVAGGRNPRVSPDGKSLAYWTGQAGSALYPGSAKIWVMAINGGSPRELLPDFPASAYPIWAPEGDALLFVGRGPNGASHDTLLDWWVASIDGKYVHPTGMIHLVNGRLLRVPNIYERAFPAAWLASTHQVLFAAVQGDATNIWSVGVDHRGNTFGDPQRWTGGTQLELHPAVAASNRSVTLAYTAMTQTVGIWRLPLNSRGEASGPPEGLVSGFDGISSPSVSIDGSRLVFASRSQGGQFIRMKDLKSGKTSIVASVRSTRTARPVLSGDGQTAAYWDVSHGYVVHVPNGAPERICESCGPPTHLSFDGRDVLFESAHSPEQILISSDRKPPQPLIRLVGPHSWEESAARFSPDGRWVAFSGSTAAYEPKHIWIAPVRKEGSMREDELVPLTDGTATDREPYWSPDGKRIYFLSSRDGFTCVWSREIDPVTARPRGQASHVTDFHHARRVIQGPTPYSGGVGLSVDRNSLVFAMAEYTSNIWLQIPR